MFEGIMNPKEKIHINNSWEWAEGAKELGISHRELEVFALAYEGHNQKEIGSILGLKHQSVKNHMYNLSKKLKTKNMAQTFVVLIVKNMIKLELLGFSPKAQWTHEKWIETFKRGLSEEDNTLDKKTKKNLKEIMVKLGIYGDMFKVRVKELKGDED